LPTTSEDTKEPTADNLVKDGVIDFDSTDLFDLMDFVGGGAPLIVPAETPVVKEEKRVDKAEVTLESKEQDSPIMEDVQAALEKELPKPAVTFSPPERYAYAKQLDPESCHAEYKSLKPNMAKKYPFELDAFQQAAVVCMEKGESVFVAAHTSAGKTVVAEAIYTSPIKALSNQKFRDFKMMFTDVGLVTGDIQLFPEAFCLIMTTEILRSMLYNGSEVIRDLEWVVFDEVHYINNAERGHVWEEVLIMLPSHVKIVMLSATVPNCIEFAADWRVLKIGKINVVSTSKRPVPLEHYLYTGQDGKTKKDLFKIVDMNGNWQEVGYRKAADAKANKRDAASNQGRPGGSDRGDGSNRGRGGQSFRIHRWCFMCDDNAQLLNSMDLTTEVEKSHIQTFFAQCIGRLKGSDKKLPQSVLLRGFAVHHSGILPILKEVVELLFQKGYVKILFATETFAMGVNMPARTVMAGRAGRRGLDTTGTVIVLCKQPKLVEPGQLQLIMMGKAAPLVSQFRVTYSMLLNLLRVEHLRVEDMLQRSFVESASLREGPRRKSNLEKAQQQLSSLPKIDCQMCDPGEATVSPIRQYHDVLVNFIERKSSLWSRLASESAMDKRLKCGRVLLVSSAHHNLQNQLVLLVKEKEKEPFQVLVPCWESESNVDEQKRKADDFLRLPKEEQEWLEESCVLEGLTRWGIEAVAPLSVDGQNGQRSFRMVNDLSPSSLLGVSKKLLKVDVADVLNEAKTREIPRLRSRPISQNVMKIILEMDTLSEEYRSAGPQLFDIAEDVAVSDIELAEDRRWFLRIREELMDPTRHVVRNCMRFQKHMSALRERVRIERQVTRLQYALSIDALQLSEEYQKRIEVLKALDFVDSTGMVTFKGRVACEIHHQELLITELILSKKLHERSPAEVAAMFSATTCQYKGGDGPQFDKDSIFLQVGKLSVHVKGLKKEHGLQLKEDVQSTNDWIEGRAALVKARIADVGDELRYDLMEVVYHWASGMPFSEIMGMTDAQEGLIVRCIQRLGEVCKDVR
ncbi:DSHCT domain protein, partial [Cooperia oncophora]